MLEANSWDDDLAQRGLGFHSHLQWQPYQHGLQFLHRFTEKQKHLTGKVINIHVAENLTTRLKHTAHLAIIMYKLQIFNPIFYKTRKLYLSGFFFFFKHQWKIHHLYHISVCVSRKKVRIKIQTFWDDRISHFLQHQYLCMCACFLKKKAMIKIQSFWDETNQPLCTVMHAPVHVLKKYRWKISYLYNIDICACLQKKANIKIQTFWDKRNITILWDWHLCVFWKKIRMKIGHLYHIDICACLQKKEQG